MVGTPLTGEEGTGCTTLELHTVRRMTQRPSTGAARAAAPPRVAWDDRADGP